MAYCNIVKYGNIKYAMIDQINNPTPGFEEIIWRHFYLKKDLILLEVKKWYMSAEIEYANYKNSLVQCHNRELCNLFGADEHAFKNNL